VPPFSCSRVPYWRPEIKGATCGPLLSESSTKLALGNKKEKERKKNISILIDMHVSQGLFIYTVDHEVISRPCKICDWLLIDIVLGSLVYTKQNNVLG